MFIMYQSAYEVLKDPKARDTYNKFGSTGIEGKGEQLMSMSFFYVMWLVVGYLMTMGKGKPRQRHV